MVQDPLLTTLLELDAALKSSINLIVGGGYGLFLKQLYLKENPNIQTLFPFETLPAARTTEDIDIILQAELVTNSDSMRPIRQAIDDIGFSVVPTAKYMQFVRKVETGTVKIDLLAGPLGLLADRVPPDSRRVKPQPSVKLHARKLDEALAVERHTIQIPIQGALPTGNIHQTSILIPQTFSYLLTKLFAFRDQLNNTNKDLGRHHALDIYRIIGMLTREEDFHVRALAKEFGSHPTVVDAREIIRENFIQNDAIGHIRIKEHQLATATINLERLAKELDGLLS